MEIKLETPDLKLEWKKDCNYCYGTGKDFNNVLNKPKRKSKNWVAQYGYCQYCGGRGSALTEFGSLLLDFLENYYRPNILDSKMEDIADRAAYKETHLDPYD